MADPASQSDPQPLPSHRFRRSQRLAHAREFQAVFDGRMRKNSGPLTVFAIPNGLPNHRLGLSIGRAAGNAVVRSRLKRLVRECFRTRVAHLPLDPGGLDLVVSVRAHDPVAFEQFAATLSDLVLVAMRDLAKRRDRSGPNAGGPR